MARDVDEQRRVVRRSPFLLVESGQFADPQCDPTLTQDVLHGLTEAEVDPEGQRGEQLRHAHACRETVLTHRTKG